MTRGKFYLITMTRGNFNLITDKRMIESCEFNGDMYGSPLDTEDEQKTGHYKKAIELLKKVKTIIDFKREINAFNKATFNYKNIEFYNQSFARYLDNGRKEGLIEMTDSNYFTVYFSDYLYFKNCSKRTIDIKDRKNKLIKLKPMEIATFNFGYLIEVI